jgi:GDPmannose 4,6-dehydratase
VTRKITRAVAHIKAGRQKILYLGNLDARRDWGYAPEYVEGMWAMLQQAGPQDYVLGTGESHSIRDFVQEAFGYAGIPWKRHVRLDPRYRRPLEVDHLRADASKARKILGWSPRITFSELVRIMVDADLQGLGLDSPGEGARILRKQFGSWHRWSPSVRRALGSTEGTGSS